MSLMPSLFALLAVLMLTASAGRLAQDASLLASQQADRLIALQRAEIALAHAAEFLAGDMASAADSGGNGDWDGMIETLPSADDAELGELPLELRRVTVSGAGGSARVRLQADFAVDLCESAYAEACVARVRRIAWRQLPSD